jgi:glycosyltransferase involved in cell wall biosynthesis
MTGRLSVFIITFNEEKNIRRCLESIRWADEIVVVDSGSRDETERVCREFTDRFFVHAFKDYAEQKNHALSQVSCKWALSIDADEELTEPLKNEILAVLSSSDPADAYSIPRRSCIFERWFRCSGTQDDRPVRLFMTKKARFNQPIHETLSVQGTVGKLCHSLNHYTYSDISDHIMRLNRYTSMEAEFLNSSGHRAGNFELLIKPFLMFFELFVLRQGFRDGIEGFWFCCLSGFYVFLKHAKLNEITMRT